MRPLKNCITLKLLELEEQVELLFETLKKLHYSQTFEYLTTAIMKFETLKKLHYSQTAACASYSPSSLRPLKNCITLKHQARLFPFVFRLRPLKNCITLKQVTPDTETHGAFETLKKLHYSQTGWG